MSRMGKIHGNANGCARCGEQFGAMEAFDRHQDVDYDRDPVIVCRDPASLSLTLDVNGVWRMPVKDPDWGQKRHDASARSTDAFQGARPPTPSGSTLPATESRSEPSGTGAQGHVSGVGVAR